MADIALDCRTRTETGRHVKHLRREGQVPAILYGHQVEPVSLSADQRSLERIWLRAGRTHLVDLRVDGGTATKVIIRALQLNPRTNRPQHADFFAVNLKEKLTADVPVILVGESPAAEETKVGQLQQTLMSVKVECLPSDLPSQISVDVSGLTELDQSISMSDVTLPHGVNLVHDTDEQIVKIVPHRVQAAEEPTEAEAAAAASAQPEEPAAE
jgi:large subunit ribosomal protein L25